MDIFNFQDLSSEFSVMDISIAIVLSFGLSAFIGWIYKYTHRGTSYTQSFVFTLVINGMVVALVMMIVGSSIARAFSLVGALSIIRFRNAVKDSRDVGFIFFTMAVGMAVGTQFYLLALIATVLISIIIVLMDHFNWYSRSMSNQILRIEIPNDIPYDSLFNTTFGKYTSTHELISVDSVQSGTLTELTYCVGMKKSNQLEEFLTSIRKLVGSNKVTLFTGYNSTDL